MLHNLSIIYLLKRKRLKVFVSGANGKANTSVPPHCWKAQKRKSLLRFLRRYRLLAAKRRNVDSFFQSFKTVGEIPFGVFYNWKAMCLTRGLGKLVAMRRKTPLLRCRMIRWTDSIEVKGAINMKDIHTLSHSTRNCKYHVVFVSENEYIPCWC